MEVQYANTHNMRKEKLRHRYIVESKYSESEAAVRGSHSYYVRH